jgi:speckle-type POZ protein
MGSSWRPENTDSIALYLVLDDVVVAGDEAAVFAQATFSLLDQRSREPVYTSTTANIFSAARRVWGYERFIKRRDLEQSSGILKDDRFAIRVQVHLKKEAPFVAVPPPDIRRHIGDLLMSGSKEEAATDVEFLVGGETFAAHRLVLGARSPVFRAELFGPMKEGAAAVIQIDDMEPQVFGGLLAFVYTDAWPEIKQEDDESIMAQHLLAAADMYGLQRLKLMCEDRLRKRIDASSVASVLALAEQHQCPGLKKACFDFLGVSAAGFLEAIETQEFDYLARSCPTIVKELISGLLARDLERETLGELCSWVPLFRGL